MARRGRNKHTGSFFDTFDLASILFNTGVAKQSTSLSDEDSLSSRSSDEEVRPSLPKIPTLSSLFSTQFLQNADISIERQDELYDAFLEAAKEKRVTFMESSGMGRRFVPTPTPENRSAPSARNLKNFWTREIVGKNNFPAMIQLYLRYKRDPKKAKKFQTLSAIIKDPAMDYFWGESLKEFGKVRYRLKNQPRSEPDKIHPFEIIAGEYYQRLIEQRIRPISSYIKARAYITASNLDDAIDEFRGGLRLYFPTTREEQTEKDRLIEQKEFLKKIQSDIKAIEVKIKRGKKLNAREMQIFNKAQIAFDAIKKIMEEKVIPRQRHYIEEGIEFQGFFAFWTVQTMDDHRLDVMNFEKKLFRSNPKTFTERDLFYPDALTLIEEIDRRFNKYRDVLIYPSYVLGAHLYHNRALRYIDLVKMLVASLDPGTLVTLARPCGTQSDDLPRSEQELVSAIYYYRDRIKTLQTQALTYAKAADELEKTGNYDAITNNITSAGIRGLLKLDSGQCRTLDEFTTKLSEDIRSQWNDLSEQCDFQKTRLTIPAPTSCQQEVENILKRHNPTSCSKETLIFV